MIYTSLVQSQPSGTCSEPLAATFSCILCVHWWLLKQSSHCILWRCYCYMLQSTVVVIFCCCCCCCCCFSSSRRKKPQRVKHWYVHYAILAPNQTYKTGELKEESECGDRKAHCIKPVGLKITVVSEKWAKERTKGGDWVFATLQGGLQSEWSLFQYVGVTSARFSSIPGRRNAHGDVRILPSARQYNT